jgi:D-glycero-alpha-D-manno-heptose 1-phosphate guanylyltransferase
MLLEHKQNKAVISIAVKEMTNFDRYGNVKIRNGIVSSFEEKRFIETGFINGGIYLINKLLLKSFPEEDKFSFEQGFMEKSVSKLNIHAFQSDGYFIDIGIPEDYEKAQNELLDTGKPEN